MISEILKVARQILADDLSEGLEGMSKRKAKKLVNEILADETKGFFKDDTWRGVYDAFDALEKEGIEPLVEDTYYSHDRNGVPESKTWEFIIKFVNDKDKEVELPGIIVAAGAGSENDPLERYDLAGYVS